uniref:Uncharacterized protein n=1 Tax=Meloidogyne enterolobii TaxID=390850 RepID=A0A6V7VTS6_MELEN|nr:unnamed protein product [Meloidogyne enterolobii]
MIKFNCIILIYLIIFLKIQCDGKLIHVEVKIRDDWEEKREFIYLKNVEIKDRFVLKVIEKKNNRFDGFNKNIEGYLRSIDLNLDKNMFEVEISDESKYIPSDQLKKKILIEITNEIIQNFLPGFEKMVLRNNNFIENNNIYETSILYKSHKNFKLFEENIDNYKNKLLSSYLTEINLIGYKIEMLEKQKFEYPKEELEGKFIYIGIKIGEDNEVKLRTCFNCRAKQNDLFIII